MTNISDLIELYLKKLLSDSLHDYVEVQRRELANRFNCVPSQINYVLTTRFSAGHGYLVESRRGGGGFVRIVKLPLGQRANLVLDVCSLIGDSISQTGAAGLIRRLLDEELITLRESHLMQSAIRGNILRISLPARDQLRALILKAMVTEVLRN
ncbi:MAG: Transcriptional regulator CtsR [Pelotomaculum sp. PtaU1.Bin035]|nr:MAG: Transcriptional regulator CtsR [Pelotomaculum sp. PtaU1.Bin035]